jgi:threonine synthase
MSFVTHLESALDGTVLAADTIQTTHRDRPLWVRYDLDAVKRSVTRQDLGQRPPTMWRYRDLLPIAPPEDGAVSLGETMTPLVPCPRLAEALGMDSLLIKDESRLPTGSFKSRGMAVAVSMAKRFGLQRVAVPSAGNAGGAMAAYAARAAMECYVFMPADTPAVNQYEAALHGARVFLVDGLISDCGRLVREGTEPMGWFDLSTLREPYRLEGKKTMGLAGTGRATGMAVARRHPVSHWRGDRPGGHVEGVRRACSSRLAARRRETPDVLLPVQRLRSDGGRVR